MIFLAVAAQTPEARAQAKGQLSQALRGLFALADSYPDLEATANGIGVSGLIVLGFSPLMPRKT